MTQPPFDAEEQREEVSLLLSDARERAQAIIDESIGRAQELLSTQPSSQTLERIRLQPSQYADFMREDFERHGRQIKAADVKKE